MKSPLQEEFEQIATDLIKEKKAHIKIATSTYKIKYMNELRDELNALKEVYAVVLTNVEDFDRTTYHID